MNFLNQLMAASIAENFKNVVSDGLPIMVAGMLGIFVVIGIIILSVYALSLIKCDGNFTRGLRALFGKK